MSRYNDAGLSPEEYRRGMNAARSVLSTLKPVLAHLQKDDQAPAIHRNSEQIKRLSKSNPVGFAQQYIAKNAVKCAIAAEIYKQKFKNTRRVIDLGTGPGTFLIAFSAKLVGGNEFVGVDLSHEALYLARDLFVVAGLKVPLLVHGYVPSAIAAGGSSFTASYLLTELDVDNYKSFFSWVNSRPEIQLLVVDYPDVARKFFLDLRSHRDCRFRSFSVELPRDIANVVRDDRISFGTVLVPRGGI